MPRSGWRRWRAWAPTPTPSRSGLNRQGRVTRKSRETQLSGDRAGIASFPSPYAPLDESLARVVIDLGQRPYLSYNVPVRGRIGTLESEVLEEFWRALSIHLGATIHVDLIRGRNRHHIVEATFKALGLALHDATASTGRPGVPSSKGVLK